MSRFRVLRIDHFDPVAVGRKYRRIFYIYTGIMLVVLVLINIRGSLKDTAFLTISVILPIAIFIFLLLILRLKYTIRKIKTIGNIEFTTSGIKKKIGDSLVEYSYQNIKEIEIQKHIPATSLRESGTGYFSYIMKISFLETGCETIVVADWSIDPKKKMSIIGTLKTLRRICPFEIKLP